MITREKFEKDIHAIFGEGNLQYAYDQLPKHLGTEQDHEGNILTYPVLMRQFKRHHDAWQKEFGDTEPRYLNREDKEKRKNIVTFLGGKWYQHHWNPRSHPRDKYLFGDADPDFLTQQRKEFEENNQTRKIQ